jgi:iron complex transport system ATP-binding protein
MLLDEPASHLDAANSEAIIKVLKGLSRQKKVAVLCVTHDLLSAAARFDRIILMKRGRIAADGKPAEALTKRNIKEIFGSDAEIVFDDDCVSYKIPRTRD